LLKIPVYFKAAWETFDDFIAKVYKSLAMYLVPVTI